MGVSPIEVDKCMNINGKYYMTTLRFVRMVAQIAYYCKHFIYLAI